MHPAVSAEDPNAQSRELDVVAAARCSLEAATSVLQRHCSNAHHVVQFRVSGAVRSGFATVVRTVELSLVAGVLWFRGREWELQPMEREEEI